MLSVLITTAPEIVVEPLIVKLLIIFALLALPTLPLNTVELAPFSVEVKLNGPAPPVHVNAPPQLSIAPANTIPAPLLSVNTESPTCNTISGAVYDWPAVVFTVILLKSISLVATTVKLATL